MLANSKSVLLAIQAELVGLMISYGSLVQLCVVLAR